jgi:hypothetical protein
VELYQNHTPAVNRKNAGLLFSSHTRKNAGWSSNSCQAQAIGILLLGKGGKRETYTSGGAA